MAKTLNVLQHKKRRAGYYIPITGISESEKIERKEQAYF